MITSQFEELYPLDLKNDCKGKKIEGHYYLKPGEIFEKNFSGEDVGVDSSLDKNFRLRLIGEVDLYHKWRGEGNFDLLYRLIDDALTAEDTHHSRFSLKLSSSGDNYARKAYYKVFKEEWEWPLKLGEWNFGLWYKKQDVKLLEGGQISVIAEVYYKKEGLNFLDIKRQPDERHIINLGEGTSDWTEKNINITLNSDIGSIFVYLVAENFTGTILLEDMYLIEPDKKNVLPPFDPSNPCKRDLNWVGENLSRKEWPEFEIVINGEKIFKGELFQRLYAWPENEIDIPSDILKEGNNSITIKLISAYREALPYKLRNLEFICVPNTELNILSCPKVTTLNKEFVIMVSTANDNTEVFIESSDSKIIAVEKNISLKNKGLNFIKLKSIKTGINSELKIKTKNNDFVITIDRIVERPDDSVVTGTSDAVYINQNISDMEQFLTWYSHNQIGDFITFRPVYRWAGTRVYENYVWERIIEICKSLNLPYALMRDGRELPGCRANPNNELLESPLFLGSQSHEQDGANNYWGPRQMTRDEETYYDIWSRSREDTGLYPIKTPIRTDKGTFRFLNIYGASNMKEAADNFINGVREITKFSKRHMGPSVMYKYLYQAGVELLGGELMYGPIELVISALRGASHAYGKDIYGSHLAVQWSTFPHDTPERARRYSLALYSCYMHGISQINTEEGLWRIESGHVDFERFGKACTMHKEVQQNFYRYVQTHSRRGKLHTPVALLHGQYDGWQCFMRGQVWGQSGPEWKFGTPEESWDLLKVFYPLSIVDITTAGPCENVPQGFYTGTPYGVVNILPIEADTAKMNEYKLMAFLGWNSAEEKQVDKLVEFVNNGGTVMLGLPHLYTSLKRSEALGDNPQILDNSVIKNLIGAELEGFISAKTDNGNVKAGKLKLNGAEVLQMSNDGAPVVIQNKIGNGKVIFVNIKAYPAEETVKSIYKDLLSQIGNSMVEYERSKGWMTCSDVVSFTAYDWNSADDMRTLYFMNINWWENENVPAKANLVWGERDFELMVSRGYMNQITLAHHWAVWTYDGETEAADIVEKDSKSVSLTLQGSGKTSVKIFSKTLSNKEYELKVASKGKNIYIEPSNENEYTWIVNAELEGTMKLDIEVEKK